MKKAYWIRRTHLFRADEYVCSACGEACGRACRTCPRCGAAMERTGYDPSWADEAECLSAMTEEDW